MASKRVYGFDFARAFAILGMMFVNYKIVFTKEITSNHTLNSFLSLFEGRAAAVFLVLSGIGIGLMTQRGYLTKDRKIRSSHRFTLIKRALFLFVLGLILYYTFEWTADILHYYGVYMLAITLLLYLKPLNLIIASFITICIGTFLQLVLNYTNGWDATMTSFKGFSTPSGFISNTFFNGYHPFFPWFAFILIGLALSRIDFSNKRKVITFMTVSLFAVIVVESISLLLVSHYKYSEVAVYLFDTKPMNPSFLYMLASSAWAVFFIGLCVLIDLYAKEKQWFLYIAITGQMALTHYVLHVVAVLGVMSLVDGLAYHNEVFVVAISIISFCLMVIFSNIWGSKFNNGPLELCMRKVSQ